MSAPDLRSRLKAVAAVLRSGELDADAEQAMRWYVDGLVSGVAVSKPLPDAPAAKAKPIDQELMTLVHSKGRPITVADVIRTFQEHGPAHGKQSLAAALGCGHSSAKKLLQEMSHRKLIKKNGRNWVLSAVAINGKALSGDAAVADPWSVEVGTIQGTKVKLIAGAVIREWMRAPVKSYAEFLIRFNFSKGTADRALKKLVAAGILVKVLQWWGLSDGTLADARSRTAESV